MIITKNLKALLDDFTASWQYNKFSDISQIEEKIEEISQEIESSPDLTEIIVSDE